MKWIPFRSHFITKLENSSSIQIKKYFIGTKGKLNNEMMSDLCSPFQSSKGSQRRFTIKPIISICALMISGKLLNCCHSCPACHRLLPSALLINSRQGGSSFFPKDTTEVDGVGIESSICRANSYCRRHHRARKVKQEKVHLCSVISVSIQLFCVSGICYSELEKTLKDHLPWLFVFGMSEDISGNFC